MTAGGERLQNLLARAGIASRRGSAALVESGAVTVDGLVVREPGARFGESADIRVNGRPLAATVRKRTIVLNKPVGVLSTMRDPFGGKTVADIVKTPERLVPVGRLDRDSEGLLLFTNDGDMAQFLTHPSHQVEKTYVVDCDGVLTEARIRKMLSGVEDEGELLRALKVTKMREKPGKVMFEVVLGEGHKREIRRMCAKVGLNVVRLARTKFAGIELGTLPTGEWRCLADGEVEALKKCMVKMAGGRSK